MSKEIRTNDGSPTLFSEKYGEPFHSISAGAFKEASEKFIKPCRILETAKEKGRIKIFDICFGLGFNSIVAIDSLLKLKNRPEIFIVSFEKDIEVIHKSFKLNWKNLNYLKPIIKSLLKNRKIEKEFVSLNYFSKTLNLKIKLFIGEGRKIIKYIFDNENYENRLDALFHDPFSPKVNPELWTLETFKMLYDMTEENGILATYSSATPVRKGLLMAGFKLSEGVAVGRKRTSTVAFKSGKHKVNKKTLRKLLTSPYSIPFRDPKLTDSPELIKSRKEGCVYISRKKILLETIY